MIKYPPALRTVSVRRHNKQSMALEITWIVIPALICVVLFFWGASLFFAAARPPQGAMEIFVVGKQWMWHLQHSEGPREINQLHVPVDVPVRLTMTSEDVIHDFFVPAFRMKMDVLPGRYTSEWFRATQSAAIAFSARSIAACSIQACREPSK